jgi:WD40 repeat protein
LAFSPDGGHVYVYSPGRIKIIDPNANRITLAFPDPFGLVPTLSVAEDGGTRVTYESPEAVDGFALSPDGSQIVTFTMDRSIDLNSGAENVRLATWDAQTGKYGSEVRFSGDLIHAIEFSPNGNLLAIGNRNEVWIWNTAIWQVKEKYSGHAGEIVDLVFTPEGTRLLSAGRDGTVRVWSLGK